MKSLRVAPLFLAEGAVGRGVFSKGHPASVGAMYLAPLLTILWCGGLKAGNNGYFTTYNSEVERGELELMFMNDLTAPSKFRRQEEGFGDYFSHMVELEYGLTDQLATEFMIEWFEDVETGQAKFTGFRWENRFRLFRNPVPLNPMIYAEYEDLDPETRFKMEVSGWVRPPHKRVEREVDRERILETRLILSDYIGPVNAAFNWINETDLPSGETAFGYSLGLMWMIHRGGGYQTRIPDGTYACPMHPNQRASKPGSCPQCGMPFEASSNSHGAGCKCGTEMPGCSCTHCHGEAVTCPCAHAGMVGIGLELYGALGDTKDFALWPSRQEHYLGPILTYHLDGHWMIHTQLAIGLSESSDNLVRFTIGYEF